MTELTKEAVLEFLTANPHISTKRDIARGLKVKGPERAELRGLLNELEDEGRLERTGKRAFAQADKPPPTGVVQFERVDDQGDLIGRVSGREGPFGPDIEYAGYRGKHRKGRAPGIGDRALCAIEPRGDTYRARIIKLFDKDEDRTLVGLFTRGKHGGRIVSASRKDRRELLVDEGDINGAADGDLVEAKPKHGKPHGPKRAIIKEVIGRAGDPRAASLLSIHAHGIPTEFPDEALKQAREAKPASAEREDLTKVPLITIDPADARDHDDAVFAEELSDGWRVIVAIADVAAYVTEGSALDREAMKRGNSTYFPDRVVPMLPFELSADECSLRENELRRCLAVEMTFDKSGTKRGHRFIRGMMRSAGKLSYAEAQAAIDGHPTSDRALELLDEVLKPLWGAYAALSKARDKRGPLGLELPERRIEFSDDGTIEGIRVKERFDAHKLIEEMMIQANVAAAEALENAKSPLLYRVHDQPSDAKIAALADLLQTIDIKWPKGERPQTSRFNRLIEDTRGGDNETMVMETVLRSQSQAIYASDNLGHFGLNLAKYAHFTSPIRRYADLIVHRALISGLALGPDGLGKEEAVRLAETADHLVTTERRSMAAEREATDRYLALFLEDRVGAEFEGRITGVTGAGLFVRLAETAADGFIPIRTLSNEFWIFDDKAMSLVARGSGLRFELGQPVTVELKEVTPLQGGLLLEMLSKPRPKKKGAQTSKGEDVQHKGRRKKTTTPKHRRKMKRK
ncbi:MAG: ribonuclease R [Pseudomonadota bacterium]